MRYAAPIARLLEEFERLPGIGPKSAQRLAFHILKGDDEVLGMIGPDKPSIGKDDFPAPCRMDLALS